MFTDRRKSAFAIPCMLLLIFLLLPKMLAQSTFGSIVGTVKDASGARHPQCFGDADQQRHWGRKDRGLRTSMATIASSISTRENTRSQFRQAALKSTDFSDLDLQSRETKRVDATLKLGAASETVMVEGASAGVITTEVSNLSETKTGRELTELPVAVYSRSTGSTSPIDTLSTEPGVQVDDDNNLVIDGTTPALMSYTIDGISSVERGEQRPYQRAFPVLQLHLRNTHQR